jgi:putative phosphoribosyl transferase
MMQGFRDRAEAGRELGAVAQHLAGPDTIVLGLPRGGIPVAAEVARALGAPLNALVVRKLGLPGHEELAIGAIASGGVRVIADEVVRVHRVSDETIDAITERERAELARREAMLGMTAHPNLQDKVVVIVDDGLATGSTMRAAVAAVQAQRPRRVIVAVPVGAPGVVADLGGIADEVLCLLQPASMMAVGAWYADFSQTTDEQVRDILSAG